MHIHDTLQSPRFGRDDAASNILAAEIAAFTIQWCYAKITPAALHRGNFASRGKTAKLLDAGWNFGRAIFRA
jgi:hypothetical protein